MEDCVSHDVFFRSLDGRKTAYTATASYALKLLNETEAARILKKHISLFTLAFEHRHLPQSTLP